MTSQIRVDEITNRSGLGTVTIYDNGFEFTGVTTFTEDVDITGGLTIGGVLTYEDTTNIDSVGVVTARAGIHVTGGNLAVGHNNPSVNLHVKGSASNGQIYLGGTGAHSQIYADNDGVLILNADQGNSASSSYLGFNVDNIERLRITSTGDMGLGTATPTSFGPTFQVAGTDPALLLQDTATAVDYFGMNIASGAVNTWFDDASAFVIHTATGLSGSGLSERLRISSNGAVCIGDGYKSSGGGQLTIRGLGVNSYAVQDYQYVGTPSSNNTLSQIRFTANTSGSSVVGGARIQASADADWSATGDAPTRLQFYTTPNGSASQLERLRISSGGNVGINETAPDRTLHINSGATDTALKLESTDTEVSLELTDNTGSSYIGGGGSHLNFYSGGNERARFDSSGNFGLGTNNPNDQTSGGYRSFTVNGSSGGIIDLRRGDIALSGGRLVGLQHEFGLEARSQNSSSQISFYVNNAYTGRWTVDGLCFGNDTAAANALDDYEEGTWTPTCASASSVSYTNQYGRYTKVGNCITIWWDLIWNSLSGPNNARIGGLPYTPVANTNQGGYGIPVFRDASGTNSENRIYGNSSYFLTNGIMLQHYNSSGNPTAGSFAGSGRITGWAQYFNNNAY